MPSERLGRGVEIPGVGGIDGDRLLAQDVGAGLHGGLGVLMVEHRRAPDHHRVQIMPERLPVVLGDVLETEAVLQHLEGVPALANGHHQLHVVPRLQYGDVVARRPRTGADHTYPHPIVRTHEPSNPASTPRHDPNRIRMQRGC